ncbi:hypothetical protein K438DRAFT_2077598 [Mycena galopus ATCC 62051]|nr:hypothetical protein K438DRAFT_2077598 [Mycena galopus ATCC 62051]
MSGHETVHQETKRLECETKLRCKIDSWMAIQQLFIPEVTVLWDREDAKRKCVGVMQPVPGLKAQDMSLWLPSTIGTRAQCPVWLQEYEFQLRQGQAVGALKVMPQQTRILRIDCAVDEYRAALVKLGAILKQTEWQEHLRPLLAEETGKPEEVVKSEWLRIKWARMRAKAMRYAEKINLVEEEMRRVLQFLRWRRA